MNKDDPDSVFFNEFLERMRDGLNTEADYEKVRKSCSRCSMGLHEWAERGFEDSNTTYLYTNNKDVHKHNEKCMNQLDTPIALIEARHTGQGKKMKADAFRNMEASANLCVGAYVYLTLNLLQSAGLCNGATGIVKDIIYEEGTNAPALPKFVIVDFGLNYTGPQFFKEMTEKVGILFIHTLLQHGQRNKVVTKKVQGP